MCVFKTCFRVGVVAVCSCFSCCCGCCCCCVCFVPRPPFVRRMRARPASVGGRAAVYGASLRRRARRASLREASLREASGAVEDDGAPATACGGGRGRGRGHGLARQAVRRLLQAWRRVPADCTRVRRFHTRPHAWLASPRGQPPRIVRGHPPRHVRRHARGHPPRPPTCP